MSITFGENIKNLSDNVLIERINAGELELLQIIISRYTPTVRFYAKKIALHESDVEDMVQDGLIALYSAVKSFVPGKAAFSTFATLCIKRAMLGVNRIAVRKRNIPSELLSSLDEAPETFTEKSPETVYIEKESLERLTETIRLELSAFEYKVLNAFLEGKSYSQIADDNGITVKSVDNALSRIRGKLKGKK